MGYEIFAGNTADVTTVEEMVELMEKKYGMPKRIWVMDRGMVSEENIDFLRERGARYIVGTPKSQLKAFEAKLLEEEDWAEVQPGVEVKLVAHPDGPPEEQYVLCRSSARREKELAMLERPAPAAARAIGQDPREPGAPPRQRPRAESNAASGAGSGASRRRTAARSRRLNATQGPRLRTENHRAHERTAWAAHAHGAYLLRTNCTEQDPGQTLALVYSALPGRGCLPHQQKRSEPATRLSSKDRTGRSPHPGLLFKPRPLADPGDVDARQRAGRLRPPVDQGNRHRAQHGRGAPGA